jgi:hypothetical protein
MISMPMMSMATTDVVLPVPEWETIKERLKIYTKLPHSVLSIEIQLSLNEYKRQLESFRVKDWYWEKVIYDLERDRYR